MYRLIACLATVLLLGLSLPGSLLAEDYIPGGKGTIVENWMVKDGEQVLGIGRPMCLYIFNGVKGANADAKFLEGAEFLGHADVQKALKNVLCIKMDISRSDKMPKKWPQLIVDRAKSYKSAVLLLSSDMSMQVYFKKNANDGGSIEAVVKPFLATVDKIVAFEAQKKAAADKAEKKEAKADKKEPEDKKIRVPGLPDPDKKDEKKEEKKEKKPNTPVDE